MFVNIYEIERGMQQEVASRDRKAAQWREARAARQAAQVLGSRTLLRAGRLVVGWTAR